MALAQNPIPNRVGVRTADTSRSPRELRRAAGFSSHRDHRDVARIFRQHPTSTGEQRVRENDLAAEAE